MIESGRNIREWLPVSINDAKLRDWDSFDVIIVTGDAYIDHPAFGAAMIGRIIEKEGYKVGIIPQPNWKDDLRDFKKLGKPRLFFAVTAGNMDSMVNHYTANKRLRSDDAYTPDGKAGFRPDYAVTKYTSILKNLFPDTPVVIGGIEASLRRLAHYDYWADSLKPSVLIDSKADLLLYGMAEQSMRELLLLLDKNIPFRQLKTIPQTAFLLPDEEKIPVNKQWENLEINSFERYQIDKKAFAEDFKKIEIESNKVKSKRIIQQTGAYKVIINPPFPTIKTEESDRSYDLKYTRLPHPKYNKKGPIPAFEMIKFSVTMHRGCFGGCSFCSISMHQGKFVTSRSKRSIINEVKQIMTMPGFKGYISDLGGPTANMYQMKGIRQEICDLCSRPSCIHPQICKNLDTSHKALLDIYRSVDTIPGIKKSFIGSGIRYDLFMQEKDDPELKHRAYFNELVINHVSGRLKVAPEHTEKAALDAMRKPDFKLFQDLKRRFDAICHQNKIDQQIVPYFISGHPGTTNENMAELAVKTKKLGFRLEQIQDFTPTPMTLASVMYYTGFDPYSGKKIHVPYSKQEKQDQLKFFFWYKPENKSWIREKLVELNRADLAEPLLEPVKFHPGNENRQPRTFDQKTNPRVPYSGQKQFSDKKKSDRKFR